MSNYEDFNLQIIRIAEGSYKAIVGQAPVDSAPSDFSISDLCLEALPQGNELPTHDGISKFGKSLFKAIFKVEMLDCLIESRKQVRNRGMGLRIKINLSGVPELAALPWEYLCYEEEGEEIFLARSNSPKISIVRYLKQLAPATPSLMDDSAISEPLRILVVISMPEDQGKLEVEQEWERLQDALADLAEEGLVDIDFLEKASTDTLRDKLVRNRYHLFHFIGHGTFDHERGKGVVMLEDEGRSSEVVEGARLAELLSSNAGFRFAFLNACEGAVTSNKNAYTGVAQSLFHHGNIPAVIATQYEMTDDAAIKFSQAFYKAVAAGYSLDAAVSSARLAIVNFSYGEWGTPVLYMRASDSSLFNRDKINDESRKPVSIKALYRNALRAMDKKNWEIAIEKLQKVVALDDTHADAKRSLREAHAAPLYAEGKKLHRAGNLKEALSVFKRAKSLAGNYKDVSDLIEEIEQTLPPAVTATSTKGFEGYYETIIEQLFRGRLVIFLGSNFNVCGRPQQSAEQHKYPLSADELAARLAQLFKYPYTGPSNLARVSQYGYARKGKEVYERLQNILAEMRDPTTLHLFLAGLPGRLKKLGVSTPYQLIVTTNTDDALEEAFNSFPEEYDLVYYNAEGKHAGKFSHKPYRGEASVILLANQYNKLPISKNDLSRTIILKLHGAVDRDRWAKEVYAWENDTYAVTEDHYIDYVGKTDVDNLIPASLLGKLNISDALFLGYGLDWSARTTLKRVWLNPAGKNAYVVSDAELDIIEKDFWKKRLVETIPLDLENFISALDKQLEKATDIGV